MTTGADPAAARRTPAVLSAVGAAWPRCPHPVPLEQSAGAANAAAQCSL